MDSCGPIPHYEKRREAGALHKPWGCPDCMWADTRPLSQQHIANFEALVSGAASMQTAHSDETAVMKLRVALQYLLDVVTREAWVRDWRDAGSPRLDHAMATSREVLAQTAPRGRRRGPAAVSQLIGEVPRP